MALRKFGIFILIAIVVELIGIVAMSEWIGGWPTFGLLLLGAVLGGMLAQSEGRKAWAEASRLMQAGQPPGHALLDGVCVVAGGALLAIPGFVSDLIGLTLLFPVTRPLYKTFLYGWLASRFRSGSFRIHRGPFGR